METYCSLAQQLLQLLGSVTAK